MAGIEQESASHLDKVSNYLKAQIEEQQRQEELKRLIKEFSGKSHKLLLDYGPTKIREYDRHYSYPYLDPGTAKTPTVSLSTSEEEFTVHVEGDFEKDNTPNIHPDSVVARRFSLCFQDSNRNKSVFSVNFDSNRVANQEELSSEQLDGAVLVLGQIEAEYEKQGIKRNPKGYAEPNHNGL